MGKRLCNDRHENRSMNPICMGIDLGTSRFHMFHLQSMSCILNTSCSSHNHNKNTNKASTLMIHLNFLNFNYSSTIRKWKKNSHPLLDLDVEFFESNSITWLDGWPMISISTKSSALAQANIKTHKADANKTFNILVFDLVFLLNNC